MGGFVEAIRQIGLFMIAAQVVVHLVPEKKYEKYVKLIAGVMILLQFLSPFLKDFSLTEDMWRPQMEQIGEKVLASEELPENFSKNLGQKESFEAVLDGIETEVMARLNRTDIGEAYQVIDVRIKLRENREKENEWEFDKVSVTMAKTTAGKGEIDGEEKKDSVIRIEKITVGGQECLEEGEDRLEETGSGEEMARYFEEMFGRELGIGKDCVEVVINGEI